MNVRRTLIVVLLACTCVPVSVAAKRRPPVGGRLAIVVDERLSALRAAPELSSRLIRRMGRGTYVAIRAERRSRDGVSFYKVNVTSRTAGWVQREAIVSPSRAEDDVRLMRLIDGSEEFDRVVRARIFLDNFRGSPLRPAVLMTYCLTAEEIAGRLSREATRRLDEKEMSAGGAPVFTYFLNYNGLDRYNRQGVTFVYDSRERRFYYDGEGWQELVHRYPRSPEATEARKRLEKRLLQGTSQAP